MWMCYLQIVIYLFIICKIVKNLKIPSARSAKAVSLVKNGHIILRICPMRCRLERTERTNARMRAKGEISRTHALYKN